MATHSTSQDFKRSSRAYLESDTESIIQLLSDPRLKISHENEVFAAIMDWLMFDQDERIAQLEEVLEKCIRIETLNSMFVSELIAQCSNVSDFTKVILSAFLLAVSTGVYTLKNALKGRLLTDTVDTIFVSVIINYDQGDTCKSKFCQMSFETAYKNHKYQLAPSSGDPIVVKANDTRTVDMYSFDQWTYVQSPMDLQRQVRRRSEADANKWETVVVGGCCSQGYLLPSSNNRLLWLKTGDDIITIESVLHDGKWKVEYTATTRYMEIPDHSLTLSASYANHLYIFEPAESQVYVFETTQGTFKGIVDLPFDVHATCSTIATKQNIVCLVGRKYIYVVDLNKLVLPCDGIVPYAQPEPEHPQPGPSRRLDNAATLTVPKPASDPTNNNFTNGVLTRVKMPKDKHQRPHLTNHFNAAIIHGDCLYLAERLTTQSTQLVLHHIELNPLLCKTKAETVTVVWKSQHIPLDEKVVTQLASTSTESAHVKLRLFNSRSNRCQDQRRESTESM